MNPKVGKSGELSNLINSAIQYSTQLYSKKFPKYIHKSKLNHIFQDGTTEIVNGAIADADDILKSFTQKVDIKFSKVSEITEFQNGWKVDSYFAKNVILSTGAFPQILKEPYLNIRPVWGERLDIKSSTNIYESYHKDISVSQTLNGIIRIGATHHRNILKRVSDEVEKENLVLEAKKIINLENIQISKSYSGVRSASFDYFPIFGKIVDSKKTIEKFPQIRNGQKYSKSEYIFYKNLSIFTGLGGYGFSLAPYLAKIFIDNLKKELSFSKNIEPHRFFTRWVKKR